MDIDEETEEEREERLRKRRRSRRRGIIATVIAAASLGGYLYVRYGVTKQGLGGPCAFAMHCKTEAPQCLRLTIDAPGACSRPCDPGVDCAPGIRCVKVGLDERDDRGVPLEGGYCIPQALLDARKKSLDAGGETPDASHVDSWLPVPEIAGQLEGEVTIATTHGGGGETSKSYVVKGTLVRSAGAERRRAIVDTATLRSFSVDDDKHVFSVVALGGAPGDVKVDKLGQSDRVADRTCELWRLTEARITREVCVVQGAAFFEPTAHVAAPWLRELAVRDAFPMRVVELDAHAKEIGRVTVTRFDAHRVEASEFAIPHSYRNLAGN